jgi:twitching motility protein PilT
MIDASPDEQRAQVVTSLAQALHGVISQTLVRTADGRGRKAIIEVLVMTPAIAHLLMTGKVFQIPMKLETGAAFGMQLMDQALLEALQQKQVDPDDAYLHAHDKRLFQPFVTDPILLPKSGLEAN